MQLTLLALVIAVIFVNGWTDAPNAVACAVATGSMRARTAVGMAALFNLLGILVMALVNTSVADTITGLVSFDGASSTRSAAALCAAMASIVIFAAGAWLFGIPTSESHALIAGMLGAGLALGGGVQAVPLGKVIAGLLLSLLLGGGLGWSLSRLLGDALRRLGERALGGMQTGAAAGMAFMHGAQDGQKFLAILVIADRLARGIFQTGPIRMTDHIPAMLLCAATMALGTSVGGGRILETVSNKMVTLRKPEGVCADLGGGACLLLASLTGLPMSTTHVKTTAMMGAALAAGRGRADWAVIRQMLLAWVVTFPVCAGLGWLLAKLFTTFL